jgi:hypothetical protein
MRIAGTWQFANQESCLNMPQPTNVPRTRFPYQGGHLQFNFVNRTGGPPNETLRVNTYFVQGDGDKYGGHSLGIDRYWENFSSGSNCSRAPLNLTDVLKDGDGNAVKEGDLDGYGMTIAVQITDLRLNSLGFWEDWESVEQVCRTLVAGL